MPMDFTSFTHLAMACAPAVAPNTLAAVVAVESGFDPLALGVNGGDPRRLRPTSPSAASRLAEALIAGGRDIDLGLAQINMRNLRSLGLTVQTAFEPCQNLRAASVLLQRNYRQALAAGADAAGALRESLSRYNTGDAQRGLANGYVTRVVAAAARYSDVAPPPAALDLGGPIAAGTPGMAIIARHPPPPPAWDAFGDLASASFLVNPLSPAQETRP